jgi:hypothetical protein
MERSIVPLKTQWGEGESITGNLDEAWQTAIEDVGPAGVDKGKGGKYLILPPGYKDKTPEGYIALPSGTYTGFALLRSNLRSSPERLRVLIATRNPFLSSVGNLCLS